VKRLQKVIPGGNAALCISSISPILIFAAALLFFLPTGLSSAQDVRKGYSAFVWKDSSGQIRRLSDYRGKIVVLSFWATWCDPCRHEMAMLADINRDYGRSVQLLGASVDDENSQDKVASFAVKRRISFPLLLGADTDQMRAFELGQAIPATVLLDANGKIACRILGALNKGDLRRLLDWMLGSRNDLDPPLLMNGFNKEKGKSASLPAFIR